MKSPYRRIASATLLLIASGALVPRQGHAQWTIFSKQEELRGKTIMDVGELSRETRPSTTDPQSEEEYYYRFSGSTRTVCIDESSGSDLGESESALLLQDANRVTYMATLSVSVSSIEVHVESVTIIRCP